MRELNNDWNFVSQRTVIHPPRYLMMPAVANLPFEAHPFTLCGLPTANGRVQFLMKARDGKRCYIDNLTFAEAADRTQRLYQASAQYCRSPSDPGHPSVR